MHYAIVTDLLGRIPSLENKPFVAQAHHFRMYRIAQSGACAIYLTNLRYANHIHRSSLGRTTLLTADTTLQVCELTASYHALTQDLVTVPVRSDLSLFSLLLQQGRCMDSSNYFGHFFTSVRVIIISVLSVCM